MGALKNVKLTGQNSITHGKGRRTPEITSSTHRLKQKQLLSVSPYPLRRKALSINNRNMVSIQLKIHNSNIFWQPNLSRPWIQLYDIDDLTGYFNRIKPHPELYFPIIINLHTLVAIYLVLDWLLGLLLFWGRVSCSPDWTEVGVFLRKTLTWPLVSPCWNYSMCHHGQLHQLVFSSINVFFIYKVGRKWKRRLGHIKKSCHLGVTGNCIWLLVLKSWTRVPFLNTWTFIVVFI